MKRGNLLKRTPLKRIGQRAKSWQDFRNAKFEREKDDEGLIRCQDTKVGLEKCGVSRVDMDLHHINGRDGKLLFDESKMVWLTSACHQAAHGRV